ncbi:MAG TPA: AAA family ATPase, partial [Candidatus Polarisedimenticolia bacterium]|nr:AAA family ATPase [Candidatus Polarisedimenticolia bacterium]
ALLHDPDILVLDEPFSGLDPLNTVLIKDLLRDMSRAGRLVILSTHQMPMVEALCDRVAMIDRGRLVLYGDLQEIRRGQGGTLEEIFVRTARAGAGGAGAAADVGAGPGGAGARGA